MRGTRAVSRSTHACKDELMKLLKQKGSTCLIYSAAMVLDVTPEEIIKYIGHNGEEIIWKDMNSPHNLRGVHIQELQDFAKTKGLVFAHIEGLPSIGPDKKHSKVIFNEDVGIRRFESWIDGRKAIIIVSASKSMHAVAWDGEKVFDPRGYIKSIDEYDVYEGWLLAKMI